MPITPRLIYITAPGKVGQANGRGSRVAARLTDAGAVNFKKVPEPPPPPPPPPSKPI